MPRTNGSPARAAQRTRNAERTLRAAGLLALVAWMVTVAIPRETAVTAARAGELAHTLPRWTRGVAGAVHVTFDTTPDAVTSAWLRALGGAGVTTSWSGAAIVPTAIESYRVADPAGSTVILASAGADTIVVGDGLGPLDTLAADGAVRFASLEGEATLQAGVQGTRAVVPAARPPKRVLVTGAAGWESKFLIAALEESGWQVDARLAVTPEHEVVQGAGRAAPDTMRLSAIVLLDSAAAQSTRGVEAFVNAGGGVVLAGNASRAPRVGTLVAWRAGAREVAPLGTLPGDTAWRGLSRVPLVLTPDAAALVLEARNGTPALVARRHHGGRVIGVGYDATWRWRMAGGEHSVAEHRAWWTRIVASVAAGVAENDVATAGAAPLAALHAQLGAPRGPMRYAAQVPREFIANLLGAVALAALLAEWLFRRGRGAR